jgi:hypothetical protein
LRALAAAGIAYDTSHCPGFADSACRIGLGPDDRRPLRRLGVIELPIGCIEASGGRLRHAQITALSLREMVAALRHARDTGIASYTFVSHSFELLSRDRLRVNALVRRRFEQLCAAIAEMPGVTTATYAERPPAVGSGPVPAPILPHNGLRAAMRMAEQAVSNTLYGT